MARHLFRMYFIVIRKPLEWVVNELFSIGIVVPGYALIALALIFALVICAGCRSVETTTTTKYDPAGKVVEQTIVEKKDNGWILRKKGFTMHNNTFMGKVTTAADPATGTPMSSVEILLGDNYINDIPMMTDPPTGANFSEYLHVEKSLWGSELSIMDYDRKSAGAGAPTPSVKIDLKADVQAGVGKMALEELSADVR